MRTNSIARTRKSQRFLVPASPLISQGDRAGCFDTAQAYRLLWRFAANLSTTEKAILGALIDHAGFRSDDNRGPGECYPAQERIGKLAGCEGRTVRRVLPTLEAKCYVERQARDPNAKGTASDLYRLTIERGVAAASKGGADLQGEPSNDVDSGPTSSDIRYRTGCPVPEPQYRTGCPQVEDNVSGGTGQDVLQVPDRMSYEVSESEVSERNDPKEGGERAGAQETSPPIDVQSEQKASDGRFRQDCSAVVNAYRVAYRKAKEVDPPQSSASATPEAMHEIATHIRQHVDRLAEKCSEDPGDLFAAIAERAIGQWLKEPGKDRFRERLGHRLSMFAQDFAPYVNAAAKEAGKALRSRGCGNGSQSPPRPKDAAAIAQMAALLSNSPWAQGAPSVNGDNETTAEREQSEAKRYATGAAEVAASLSKIQFDALAPRRRSALTADDLAAEMQVQSENAERRAAPRWPTKPFLKQPGAVGAKIAFFELTPEQEAEPPPF